MDGRKAVGFFGSGVLGGLGGVKEHHLPTASNASAPSPSPRPVAEESVCVARVGRGGSSDGIGVKQAIVVGGSSGGMGTTVAKSITTAAGREEGMGMEMGTDMMGSLGGSFSSGTEELFRKKRGRQRRYESDCMAFVLTPDFSGKWGRGRPRGSGKRQLLASIGEWFQLSAGGNFTAHVMTVAPGEDVAARILTFSQKGPRAICILSANGAISNVTLRQPGSSGGTLITGGISVSLAGPDGLVVGGGVAGLLLAASPIQVVVGSFLPNAFK